MGTGIPTWEKELSIAYNPCRLLVHPNPKTKNVKLEGNKEQARVLYKRSQKWTVVYRTSVDQDKQAGTCDGGIRYSAANGSPTENIKSKWGISGHHDIVKSVSGV